MGIVVEDSWGGQASEQFVRSFSDSNGWTFPAAADPDNVTRPYNNTGSTMMNVVIDLETMEITNKFTDNFNGFYIRNALDDFLSTHP